MAAPLRPTAAVVLCLLLVHCGQSVAPGSDGGADRNAPEGAAAENGAGDVVEERAPLLCDPAADRCHIVVHACSPELGQNECQAIAQCEAGGVDAGGVARAVCTARPTPCAQATHCGDPAMLPSAVTCRCGRGPACEPGAICVVPVGGGEPECRCVVL